MPIIISKKSMALFIAIIILVIAISWNQEETQIKDIPSINQTPQEPVKIENNTRSFYMGLTPFPYDITQEAVDYTYEFLSTHTNLVAHHFDSGVPWPEAYNHQEYHPQVQQNINTRIQQKNNLQEIYLAVTPLNGHRTDIAGYWAEKENQPQKENWENITFTDSRTVESYINFCETMIQTFDPKYMAYGIEVNMLADTNPEIFPNYVKFTKQVYNALKEKHPDLLIFLTFQIDYYYGNPGTQIPAVEELLPYTDVLAISTYPFTRYPDPALIPKNHFSEFASLAEEKHFAVAETGFPSDSIFINDAFSVTGTAEWQKGYAEFLFTECQDLEAEFMVWFCPIDYDATWNYLIDFGLDPIYKLWIDTGLLNEKLEEKPVLELWDNWLINKNNTIEKTMKDTQIDIHIVDYPKIASWLAKKDELIISGKSYSLVMSGWFTPEEAVKLREYSPDVLLLAGLTTTWIWDNEDWISFLIDVASIGRDQRFEIKEDMYLHTGSGERCGFGWASEEWQHEEIYAMDPRSPEWVDLVTSFYQNVLAQSQHDGIIVDMVVERQYWSDAISDDEWLLSTQNIYSIIDEMNVEDKLVIFNAGARLSDIDEYSTFFDGYLMENFMGEQLKTSFFDGLSAGGGDFLVVFGVDTDDTGVVDYERMRLGLCLSLLFDNTYFTYDFGPRDHGQAWWVEEYDVDLGDPLREYWEVDGAYLREFEKGLVVAAPNGTEVSYDCLLLDVSTGKASNYFEIPEGDARIFLYEQE